jgi:hypothetical protein
MKGAGEFGNKRRKDIYTMKENERKSEVWKKIKQES